MDTFLFSLTHSLSLSLSLSFFFLRVGEREYSNVSIIPNHAKLINFPTFSSSSLQLHFLGHRRKCLLKPLVLISHLNLPWLFFTSRPCTARTRYSSPRSSRLAEVRSSWPPSLASSLTIPLAPPASPKIHPSTSVSRARIVSRDWGSNILIYFTSIV